MKKIISLVFTLIMVFSGLLLGSYPVMATNDIGANHTMTVSPPQQKVILAPGETYNGTLLVANSSNATVDLKYSVSIGSFSLNKDEKGNADYNSTDVDTITGYNQIIQWIELEKTEGVVGQNSTDTIHFTINVPKDAPAGGQYATIIIQDDTEDNNDNIGNVTIKNVIRFAANIFAEITGETREEGSITGNNIPSFLLSSPLEATSVVKNDGNVHTDAEYILQVWPLFSDEEICTNEENVSTSLIMPETERYHTESCSLPSVGIFRAKQTVKIFGETSTVEKTVIVCPLWLLFLIIFGIAAIIIYFVTRAKARKKNAE